MTVYTWDGRVLHHNDCTFCQHRHSHAAKLKGRKKVSFEQCRLSGEMIAAVNSPLRFCKDYRQIGCECPNCLELLNSNGTDT